METYRRENAVRLVGLEAIQYAEANNLPLCKYNDPTEDDREDLTVAEARQVAWGDPRLIYIDIAVAVAE